MKKVGVFSFLFKGFSTFVHAVFCFFIGLFLLTLCLKISLSVYSFLVNIMFKGHVTELESLKLRNFGHGSHSDLGQELWADCSELSNSTTVTQA